MTGTVAEVADEDRLTGQGLVLRGVTKKFGDFTAVDDLDLTVPPGSFFALLGPSGCGKTTTLRMVAGLEVPTAGTIHLSDRDIAHDKPYRRPVNTVFQSYALFPHMTIFENVAFGLRRSGNKDVKAKVAETLDLVELGDYAKRKPTQLSGGQQQRVALARALINRPQVLLLDEPLGALDLKLRRQMQIELKRIQTEVGITFVHVTHDQEEAMTMADTVAVMNAGVIEQMGRAPRALRAAEHHVRGQLPGPVQPGRGQRARPRGRRRPGRHARLPRSVPRARAHDRRGRGWSGSGPRRSSSGPPTPRPGTVRNLVSGGVVTDVSFVGVSTQYLVRMPWGQELPVFEQNTGARLDVP